MKSLVKFEFLKILRKKSTLIVMAVSLLITAVFFVMPILQFQIYNQDGVLRGLEGIAYEKEQYAEISVTLTNEYITEQIREVQELFADPDNIGYDGNEQFLIDDAYWNGIAPREDLLGLIAKNYAAPNVSVGYNALPDLDISNGTDFYQARQEKIETILNDPSKGLSDEEKEYWQNMNSQVEEPFQYGYFGGWEVIISAFELLMFAVLAICIVIAPVFSGEYQSGTDAVILSGKYGKTKLTTAKIWAALLFGVLAFTLHILVAFAIPLAAFGIDGWNLPLQINGTTVPYPLTFLEGTLINLGVIYLVLIAMIALTLFLSARMRSAFPVGQNEKSLSGIDCYYAGSVYSHVPHPEWNQRPLQSTCFSDPLSVAEAELRIVYILSIWPGRSGCFYNESCFVCYPGADPATHCPDWLQETSGFIRRRKMKSKKYITIAVAVVVIIIAAIMIIQPYNWSKKSFEAVVQETVTQADGEIRLIVERTTEIYGDPMNSLGISEDTKLLNASGEEIATPDFKPGDAISVSLKDSFTEETPFYYPIVYEIKLIDQ